MTTSAPAPPPAPPVDVRGMFDRIAGRYDAANRVMSVGIDLMWRRQAMRALLAEVAQGARVLDLGAGTLDGALEIVRRRPDVEVVAADFAREMLKVGRGKLAPGARIATHAADGHQLPYRDGAFAGAFSGFCVRNLTDLPRAMAELRRVVQPGGKVVILEFFRPRRQRLFFDRLYNGRLLPLIGWAVTGDRDAYRYLPRSIEAFLSRDQFEQTLVRAGFARVQGRDLFPGGVSSLVVGQ